MSSSNESSISQRSSWSCVYSSSRRLSLETLMPRPNIYISIVPIATTTTILLIVARTWCANEKHRRRKNYRKINWEKLFNFSLLKIINNINFEFVNLWITVRFKIPGMHSIIGPLKMTINQRFSYPTWVFIMRLMQERPKTKDAKAFIQGVMNNEQVMW